MSEDLQTSQVQEAVLPQALEGVQSQIAPPAPPPPPAFPPVQLAWLRLAYSFEFLLALLVIVVGWTQVGGQGHLDLMPWYVKLLSVALLAGCAVRLTAAMVEHPRTWNRASRWWLTGVLLAGAVMAGITYYVHLHEVPDEPDTDETSTTSVRNLIPRHSHLLS